LLLGIAPWRVVLKRTRAQWLIVGATWLVVLAATSLLAIGVIYGDAVASTGLHRVLAQQEPAEVNVSVGMKVDRTALADADAGVTAVLRRVLGWTGGEIVRIVRTDSFALPGQGSDVRALTTLSAYSGLAEHAELVDGVWPVDGPEGGPIEAALSVAAAGELEAALGDVIELTNRREDTRRIEVRIVGLWQPIDPTEAYWLGDELELRGRSVGEAFDTYGPFVVTESAAIAAASGDLDARWRALPTFANLAVEDAREMRSDASAVQSRIVDALGERSFPTVLSDLDGILSRVDRSLLVSRSGILVLAIQFAVLAGYALVLVAGLLVDQRRVETALLRSRGATPGQVAHLAALEGIALVLPAILFAPFVAVGILELFDRVGPLAGSGLQLGASVTPASVVMAALVGVGCIGALALPALAGGRPLAATRQAMSRQGVRPVAQRLGLDIALVLVAGIGLWQLRSYGAPITASVRGTLGLDPLLVAAPAIGLLAGAVLALRVVPALAQAIERVLAGLRGLVAPLGARQLARRPLRYTRSALLLMLAAALGTFAAAYGSTWTRSQQDQARHVAGADILLDASAFPDLPGWALAPAYGGIAGVDAVAPVVRQDVEAGDGRGELVAVDAALVPRLTTLRMDLADGSLEALMAPLVAAREASRPLEIAGTPTSATIEVDARFATAPDSEARLPSDWRGLAVGLVLRDGVGGLHRFEGGRVAADGGPQAVELPLTLDTADGPRLAPAYPLALAGIELTLTVPDGVAVAGTVAVSALSVADDPGAWRVMRFDSATPPTEIGRADQTLGAAIHVGTDAEPALLGPIETTFSVQPASLATPGPLPAVVGTSFLAMTDTRVGDELKLAVRGRALTLRLTGAADAFPTTDPTMPVAIVDAPTLAIRDYVSGGRIPFADEWWLAADDDPAAAVASILAGEPYSTEGVTMRAEIERNLLAEPVALGLIGALALGSAAAVGFAAIGFVMSAALGTRERLGEFALLRALGLSPAQLSGWLTLESGFLLGIGMVVGIGLGLVLAWVVLPFVTLNAAGTAANPPPLVIVPWDAIGLLLAAALVVLVVTVSVISVMLRRIAVGGVLRTAEE
jgi:hypothetical protein